MISFPCPHCDKPLRVKEEAAGKRVPCPACSQPIPIPAAGPEVAANRNDATVSVGNDGDHPQELYDFLAPAEQPDELGRLGGFRILQVLGAGGMGVVFQAEDPRLKRKLAIKVMLPALAASATARQRFLREAQTAAALEHDHIVPILQVGEDRGVPFIAMPFLKGQPLDERLKQEPALSQAEVLRIGRPPTRAITTTTTPKPTWKRAFASAGRWRTS